MNVDQNKVVSLSLSVAEAQTVLNALSELPHKVVARLIPNLMNQVNSQLADEPVEGGEQNEAESEEQPS